MLDVFKAGITMQKQRGGGNPGQVLAFPGAEGFAKNATGGRDVNATIYPVSNSAEFQSALEASGPRFIIFTAGGVYDTGGGNNGKDVLNGDCTIAAQTAPEPVILENGALNFKSSNHIVRGIRATPYTSSTNWDGLKVTGPNLVENLIFDHCSIFWGTDGCFDINSRAGQGINNVTLQRSLIYQGLEGHGLHLLINGEAANENPPQNISYIACITAGSEGRNPSVGTNCSALFADSICYGWNSRAADARENSKTDYLNVRYIPSGGNGVYGVANDSNETRIIDVDPGAELYFVDAVRWDNDPIENHLNGSGFTIRTTPNFPGVYTANDASFLDNDLPSDCGAMHPYRIDLDQEIINFVINQPNAAQQSLITSAGGTINDNTTYNIKRPLSGAGSPTGENLLPSPAAGTYPFNSVNGGVIPDQFEIDNGFTVGTMDPLAEAPSGYLWIEEYINSFYA